MNTLKKMSSASNAGGERPSSRNDDTGGPIAKPDFFYGDRNKVDDWLNQLRMYFFFKGTPKPQQVMIAATFMRGRAQHWMKPEISSFLKDPGAYDAKGIMRSFEPFAKDLKVIFGASEDAEENAAVRLIQTLRQKGSASDYTSRFKEYMPLTNWDDEALRVMYRNGLKEHVKDELMRSSAAVDTLDRVIVEAIRIDDMLYERSMEKRHFQGKRTDYAPRGGSGGYKRDRGDPMELDATFKGKSKRGKGKGNNKKGGIKCYSCGKLGHMKKDCRKNTVQRQVNTIQRVVERTKGRGGYQKETPRQLNMMQKVEKEPHKQLQKELDQRSELIDSLGSQKRQLYEFYGFCHKDIDEVDNQIQGLLDEQTRLKEEFDKRGKDDEHALMSWTACYDDDCRVHLSDKQGSGWYPTRPRKELNVIRRRPLQQSRDGGNSHPRSPPLKREDATLQENRESGTTEIEPEEIQETPWWMRDNRNNRSITIGDYQESPTDSPLLPSEPDEENDQWEDRIEQAHLIAATQNDPPTPATTDEGTLQEELLIEESESDDEDDIYTWQNEGPHEVYQMMQLIATEAPSIFILADKERLIHPIRFDMLIDKLRAMFWDHGIIDVRYDYSKFIVERPPLGSQFSPDGSYTTPDNIKINRSMRQAVLDLKARYFQAQQALRKIQQRQKRNEQLGVIDDCNTSEESGNEEAPEAEAANGSS